MKTIFFKHFYRLTLLLTLCFVSFGCSKPSSEDSNQNSGSNGNNGNNGSTVAYKFSSPQYICLIPTQFQYFTQRSFVTSNHVFHRISSTVNFMAFNKDQMGGNFGFGYNFPGAQYATNVRPVSAATGPFCIDKSEQNMYVITDFHLYKCDLSSPNSDATLITPASNLGTCLVVKVLENGDIIFSTDLLNGSIQIVKNGFSTPQVLVSNLGATPGALDVLNNEIYFTLDVNNGSVKKVTMTGTVSTVIENLTHPTRLAFDKNDNFILEYQVTLDGANYGAYTIYSKTGTKTSDVSDDKNFLILSTLSTEQMVPLYIDTNNNLYFGHSDKSGNSSINHCNPLVDGTGNASIYKMQLLKQ